MKKAVIGIIGCGNIAKDVHFGNVFSNPKFRVKWCCDLSEDNLNFVKENYAPENITTSQIFLDLVICAPMYSPMGIMDISDPRENSPMPRIRRIAPTKNESSVPVCTGETVATSKTVISVTGITAANDSLIFSSNTVFLNNLKKHLTNNIPIYIIL